MLQSDAIHCSEDHCCACNLLASLPTVRADPEARVHRHLEGLALTIVLQRPACQ